MAVPSVYFWKGKPLFRDGKVAMSPDCCCGDNRPCSYFYGRLNADDTHDHTDKIWLEFADPLEPAPSWHILHNPLDKVPDDCCENYPLLWELPIRDYDDADTWALDMFGVCPGEWLPNCYQQAGAEDECYDINPEGPDSTLKAVKVSCGEGGYWGDGIGRCIFPCHLPDGMEAVWTVIFTIEGLTITHTPAHLLGGCTHNTFHVGYQAYAPIGTVAGYGGSWLLDRIGACTVWPGGFNADYNPSYCWLPSQLWIHTSLPP